MEGEKYEKTIGFLCGGIIKESKFWELFDKGELEPYFLCLVLPDDKYEEYVKLKEEGKEKEAEKIIKKYAFSLI